MPSSGNSVASDTMSPLPIAVCRCSWNRSIAATRSSRFSVGGCTTSAVPANVTMPARMSCGNSCTNVLAAFCAATIRLGSTSVARIDSDTSIARITVRASDGSVMTAVGRAAASSAATIASRNSSGGTCRRKRCVGLIADLTRPTFAYRIADFFLRSSAT